MTAVFEPPGQQSFFLTRIDEDGTPYTVPNAGGFVYMYEPGSTVSQPTWLDSAQTTENTNPIRLDPDGRCTIYGMGQYRQIVTDASGNLQWDQLTELGLDGSFITQTLLNFPIQIDGPNPNPPLNNPVQGTRALNAVLGSFVDARNFGALRQGSDDLAIIQLAINYAAGIGGATVYLGPGPLTTASGSQLTWPSNGNGVCLKGDGPFATVIGVTGGQTSDVLVLAAGNLAHCEITDLGFNAPVGTGGASGALIRLQNTYAALVANVRMAGAFSNGVMVQGGSNQYLVTIRDVIAPAATSANACIVIGDDTSGLVQSVWIDSCRLANSRFGVYVRNGSGINFNQSECLSHGTAGFVTSPGPGEEARAIQLGDIQINGSGGSGINLGHSGGQVFDVSIVDCTSSTNNIAGVLIGPDTNVNVISVVGSQLHGNGQQGIHNTGANGVLINNNMLSGNGAAAGNTYDGIAIDGPALQNVVSGNFIGPQYGTSAQVRYGIRLNSGVDYTVVVGNVTGNSGTAGFSDVSGGTHNWVANAAVGT